jgi:hypothetical protein
LGSDGSGGASASWWSVSVLLIMFCGYLF